MAMGQSPPPCEWISNPATGNEYRLTTGYYWGISDTSSRTPPDWFDAEAEAVAAGGHLATINDAAENLWLRDTFGNFHYWIGLTDWGSEGSFYWISGEPVTYLNWDGGQPDNAPPGGEDSVHINHFGSFGWNDLGVQGNSPYHPNPYQGIIERAPLLHVTTTNPPVGGTFSPSAPSEYQYDVNFNQAVDPASVQTTDLTLIGNVGGSVINVQVINSNMTARFTVHFDFGGSVTANIAGGAIRSTNNICFAALRGSYTVEGPPPPCLSPPPNMVGWWPGDGNAYDIVGSNSGTLHNGATFAPGMVDHAFSFIRSIGIDDYVQASDTGLPFSNAARTLDFWMKSGPDGGIPVIYGDFQPNDAFYVVVLAANACIGQWGGGDACGSTHVNDSNWHHIALTYDGVSSAILFVDGALETSIAKTYTTTQTGTLLIGGDYPHFDGLVDEVEIFNRALSQTEIQAIYNANSSGKCKPIQSPTPTATATATYTPSPTATATFTPTPTPTPTPIGTPQAGSFVIGDLDAVVGRRVTFWSAQWRNGNHLSGGWAPASFKGFANVLNPNPPMCGGTWQSDPGNSCHPPASVPAFINVIAASSITQSGSAMNGDSPKMVVIQTDPGYGPDPGHTGTGTVTAVICDGAASPTPTPTATPCSRQWWCDNDMDNYWGDYGFFCTAPFGNCTDIDPTGGGFWSDCMDNDPEVQNCN